MAHHKKVHLIPMNPDMIKKKGDIHIDKSNTKLSVTLYDAFASIWERLDSLFS